MGLAEDGLQYALAGAIADGTSYKIALLTTLPDDYTGTSLVEASGSGYARATHSAWVSVEESGTGWYRANNGTITFSALTGALTGILGWAIYDNAGTTLIAYGPTTNVSGTATTYNFVATDQPQFVSQELKVGIS
jgi:hypothetical protein